MRIALPLLALPAATPAAYAFNFLPSALEPLYGGDPNGAMAFVRLKID